MNNLAEHKIKTNISEIVYYLEEMYQMDLLSEEEMDIYENYKYSGKMTKNDAKEVLISIKQYFFEEF